MNQQITNSRRTALLLAGSLGITALLAGCGTSAPDATVTPATQVASTASGIPTPTTITATPTGSQPSSTGTAALLASVTVTPEDAAATALKTVASSRVVGIDLGREQSRVVWDVNVVTSTEKREVLVDAQSGAVLANRPDRDDSGHSDDSSDDHRLLAAAKLDHEAALRSAHGEVADGRIVELELDDEHDQPVWKVEILDPNHVKHEVKFNAVTGAITERETNG